MALQQQGTGTWVDLMALHCSSIQRTESGEIPTDQFLQCFVGRAHKCYEILFGKGILASQLSGDINNSLGNVENQYNAHKTEYCTIERMLAAEVARRGTQECFKDKQSACRGTLWSYRALNFACRFLELFAEGKQKPGDCARQTYKEVLERYHGFLLRQVVGKAIAWTSSAEEIVAKFGFATRQEACVAIQRYVGALKPILAQILAALDANGVNFPDKV